MKKLIWIICTVLYFSSFGIPDSATGASWYNTDWSYRRALNISPETPASDYQVLVTLTTATMGNPYNNVNTDGSDLRFTDSDGITLPKIESWDNNQWGNDRLTVDAPLGSPGMAVETKVGAYENSRNTVLFLGWQVGTETITIQPSSQDSRVGESSPDKNYGSEEYMEINPETSKRDRGLVKFDLSSIPSGATIVNATLTLYLYYTTETVDRTHNVHRITEDWAEESVTWNSRSTGVTWTTPGGTFNSAATDSRTVPASQTGFFDWTVTNDVSAFIAGTATNYGWIVKDSEEVSSALKIQYRTKEYSTATRHPKLEITYTPAHIWLGTGSTDWSAAGNWESGSIPTASDNVNIPDVTNDPVIGINAQVTINDLTVNNGATLTIESDGSNSGSLIVTGTSTGNATYNRYLVNDRWHLVSSPVEGETFDSGFFSTNNIDNNGTYYALIDYNTASDAWNDFPTLPSSGTFSSAKGFLMARYVSGEQGGTVGFTGTVADQDVTFTPSTAGYRWNAVGNPFTSAIGINSGAGENNFINGNSSNLDASFVAIYYWDDTDGGIGNYIAVNQSSSAFYAAPGQGFFVKAASDATAINFARSLQTHQSTTLKSGEMDWPQMELTAQKEDNLSKTTVKFINGMTPGLDIGYDAGKFKNNPEINLYTKLVEDNGVDFGLQCLPHTGIGEWAIPVGLDVKSAGEVTFSMNTNQLPGNRIPVLEDRLLDVKTLFVSNNDLYTATVSESSGEYGRFFITFATATGAADIEKTESRFRAWYHNNTIRIQGRPEGVAHVTLYDLNGRGFVHKILTSEQVNTINVNGFANGIYILKIVDTQKTELLKVPVVK